MPSFPILFTIDGSARHEVITLDSTKSLKDITGQIGKTAASSPNCAEFMAKYKKTEEGKQEEVGEIKVRWSSAGRDSKLWPQATILTEGNIGAVLQLLEPSKDVLEVKLA